MKPAALGLKVSACSQFASAEESQSPVPPESLPVPSARLRRGARVPRLLMMRRLVVEEGGAEGQFWMRHAVVDEQAPR